MATIWRTFEDTARRMPDAPAVIENDRTLTYSELCDMACDIASHCPHGVRRVGIIMDHTAEMIASMLAVLKVGACYVPAEPDFPPGRISFMMDEADIDFALTGREFAGKTKVLVMFSQDRRMLDIEHIHPRRIASDGPDDPSLPAYILYTSGTTGKPKGVCVTNGNVCHYARAFADEFGPGPGDVTLQYSVCSFDIFVEEVYGSLLNGAAIAIPSEDDRKSLKTLMDFVDRHGVTIISGFPYLLAEMNHLDRIPDSLRLLISGGDVLRGVYVDRLLGRTEVYNTYGPSETTVCAAYFRCTPDSVLEDGTYPVGHPVKGAEIRILDKNGREVPDGETGEICIYGGGVSLGYIGDREEENRAFEPVPGSDPAARMYRSGDLGYILPDGNIAFLHRKDTQIMIEGKRVEVSEVESRLYQCTGVRQALVRASEDEHGHPYMTAYVVPSHGSVNVGRLRAELAENLTPFMIPEFFVQVSSIPLTENGKPDVSELPVVLKEGTET
ncbi:MAG: amino acid adenylation domain-containing protein [Anaerovoracaceae bacterium]|jgi:D-alanine--poly(phosphoribitol) ligase subunit 1